MTVAQPIQPIRLTDQPHVVLYGQTWEFYERLLAEIGDRPLRVTFDNGDLEMMAPLPLHELWKWYISRLIELMAFDLDIEIQAYGSATFRREDLAKGLEPDECYYIRHADAFRAKYDLDLTVDPPPDLAIEIDITHRSIARQPIYAALGVPELWRFDGKKLQLLELNEQGKYQPIDSSRAFPQLPMAKFQEFLFRLESEPQLKVLKEFRVWIGTLPKP
jgi:Uma2 family endonuclease